MILMNGKKKVSFKKKKMVLYAIATASSSHINSIQFIFLLGIFLVMKSED